MLVPSTFQWLARLRKSIYGSNWHGMKDAGNADETRLLVREWTEKGNLQWFSLLRKSQNPCPLISLISPGGGHSFPWNTSISTGLGSTVLGDVEKETSFVVYLVYAIKGSLCPYIDHFSCVSESITWDDIQLGLTMSSPLSNPSFKIQNKR